MLIVPSQSEAPPSCHVMCSWMRVGLMKGGRTMRITKASSIVHHYVGEEAKSKSLSPHLFLSLCD